MTILRSGSSKKYAANWDQAFGGKSKKKSTSKKTAASKQATKKSKAKKAHAKKKSS